MTWQNQQNEYAPSEDSDQSRHPPSLIRVFAVRSVGSLGPNAFSCGQRRLWSDWADAQVDPSLCWAPSHFVGFDMSRLNLLSTPADFPISSAMAAASTSSRKIEWCASSEPRHDKTNKVNVRPAKTQISLGIRPVWSESSLSAWRKLGSLATYRAHSEDSCQTGRMHRLIWVFAGRTVTLLFLSCRGSSGICGQSRTVGSPSI